MTQMTVHKIAWAQWPTRLLDGIMYNLKRNWWDKAPTREALFSHAGLLKNVVCFVFADAREAPSSWRLGIGSPCVPPQNIKGIHQPPIKISVGPLKTAGACTMTWV